MACRARYKRRSNPKPPLPPLELTCQWCGNTFVKWPRSGRHRRWCERCGNKTHLHAHGERRARELGVLDERFYYDEIYNEHGWTCYLCGEPIDRFLSGHVDMGPTIDHVIPLERGGRHCRENVRPAHRACNVEKKDRTPEEWQAHLGELDARAPAIVAFVAEHPGCTWKAVERELVDWDGPSRFFRRVRDELLADGRLVNTGTPARMRLGIGRG